MENASCCGVIFETEDPKGRIICRRLDIRGGNNYTYLSENIKKRKYYGRIDELV